jgi:hypothetical protein
VDNDGNPLLTGALYWNTTANQMRVYDGSAWVVAYLPAGAYMDLSTNQTAAGVKTFSSNPILSAGTANGVAYLNGSKVATSGSALTFDGTNYLNVTGLRIGGTDTTNTIYQATGALALSTGSTSPITFNVNVSEVGRFTSTGLGIGTSSPSSLLSLYKYQADYGIGLYGSAQDWTIKNVYSAGGALQIASNGGTWLTLNGSGNLGLGVTPSAWGSGYRGVDIGSNTAMYDFTSGTNVQTNMYCNGYVNSSSQEIYKTSAAASAYRQISGTHRWYNAASGTAGNPISFTQAMTLNASGNLSIGATSPYGSGRLTLIPSTNPTSSTDGNNQLFIGEASANNAYYLNVGYINVGGGYAGSIQAIGGGVPCNLLLNSSGGNVLVGTTTLRGQSGISLVPNTSAGAGEITFNRASTGSTSYVVGFQNAGSTVGYIAYNSSSTTYATSSDARLKENVTNAPAAGPVIDRIRIRSFDWLADGTHQTFGGVAQELLTDAPEVDGVCVPGNDGMMGVDWSKEIQSLRARVASLEVI